MNEEVQAALDSANAVNTEFYYWASIALMVLIHAGFMLYEGGASRVKNVLGTVMKNVMTLPVVIASFFFFGRFVYNAFPTGPPERNDLAKAALAVVVGSFTWVAAAWGWHPSGWLTTELGFHDVGAAGVVHVVSGFFGFLMAVPVTRRRAT
jgi:ammonia channel protein AmtB